MAKQRETVILPAPGSGSGSAPAIDSDTLAEPGKRVVNPLEGKFFAAVDLGSNSFHMIVSRFVDGALQLVDRIREPVRLAQGLGADGQMSAAARERALSCLAQFGQRLRGLSPERVRTVATNTVRQMKNPRAFLMQAEAALGFPIEIISGREEGRITYLGVANTFAEARKRRLVIDIGGGSTEFILGQGFDVFEAESVQMGCVSTTKRFFESGAVTRKEWREVQQRLALEFAPFRARYLERGWKRVIGCSGTLKATAAILHALGGPEWSITREGLDQLIDRVLSVGDIDKAKIPGLSSDRKLVYLGGLAVIDACFRELGVEQMQVCEAALREGLLYDMLGRLTHSDPRLEAIRALGKRHSVDFQQAKRVKQTALAMFMQLHHSWELTDEDRDCLAFAAIVHEVGLSISHTQHHVHGAYILANTDLPGFTRDEQQMLALLVRCHRRSVADKVWLTSSGSEEVLPERDILRARKLATLLRLSAVLHRSRTSEPMPAMKLNSAGLSGLKLRFPSEWLASHPLTRADLKQERELIEKLGIKLTVVSGIAD
jgi:exopolyphosphatase / guanosine-5'-triphosphate,3'-diphosphate pyrophosphatase